MECICYCGTLPPNNKYTPFFHYYQTKTQKEQKKDYTGSENIRINKIE